MEKKTQGRMKRLKGNSVLEKELEKAFGNIPTSPSHYKQGSIEPIDYMRAIASNEEFLAHCILTTIKYLSRYKYKNGLEDLDKAAVYLEWARQTYALIEESADK